MAHTLRFELRKEVLSSEGKSPISAIVSVKGKRKRLSTDQVVYPWNWDNEAKPRKAIYLNDRELKKLGIERKAFPPLMESEVKSINTELDKIELKLTELDDQFRGNKITFSVEMLVESYLKSKTEVTKKEEPKGVVFDFIERYIEDHKNTRVQGSLGVYKSLRKHLKNYESAKRENKVRFEKIDYQFMQGFRSFLVDWQEVTKKGTVRTLNNITIAKQISTLKTFLGYAQKHGIEVNQNYKGFNLKKDDLEVIALTEREFQSLLDLDLSDNKRLDQVRDVFCFSCASGLRYSDLKNLRWENVKGMELNIRVQKTTKLLTVPLTPQAYDILVKYKDMLIPLPVISNQKMNDYLKELAKLAEINEPTEIIRFRGNNKIVKIFQKWELISVHAGRKSFATLSLEKGVPAETVMSTTGHTSYASFQRYVKVTEERKRNEMAKAWGKPVLKVAVNE
ncbi:site-specific recombinase XerD [Algoriphagus ratkowskyi]|uniref:Site-specific integrase n=1 Tax=Algoriphagus ratkowskyi TaxID=57028 RepID=A0A2W7RYA1_9BACT|nr:site-specific integrase [Algoriphagus ratkowskyi]PZX60197.1 site-specific recombinase XerD [Algoriphagus ratkowskyi]TXD78022.1 site-specific integrase [Algoriphagus ratkowskyi]